MQLRLTFNQSEDSEEASKLKSVLVKKNNSTENIMKGSSLVQHLFLCAAVHAQEANLPKRNLTADTDAVPCYSSSK